MHIAHARTLKSISKQMNKQTEEKNDKTFNSHCELTNKFYFIFTIINATELY